MTSVPPPLRARTPLVLAAAALAALSVGSTAGPARAAGSRGLAAVRPGPLTEAAVAQLSPQALGARQQPLLDAVQQIQQLTGANTALGTDGYAGAAISVPQWNVTLYWHGARPARLTALLARLSTTVPVRVVSADYPQRQLLDDTRRIVGHLADLAAKGIDVVRVGPRPDGSGLQVGVDYAASPTLAHVHTAPASLAQRAAGLVAAEAPGSAPITVLSSSPSSSASTADRQNDTSPYKGGARIVRAGNKICSTGYSVFSGKTHYMLFAAHCGGVNTSWQVGDSYSSGAKPMGLESARNPNYDTGLIKVDHNEATIYDKGYSSSVTEKVVGGSAVAVGTFTCQNGATSGVICNTVVDATLQTITFDKGAFTAQDEDVAHNVNAGLQAVAGGDSGGPVFVNTGTKGQVKAVGIISGGANTVTCSSSDDPSADRVCYNQLDFADLPSNLVLWQVSLS